MRRIWRRIPHRARGSAARKIPRRCATFDGFSVHANVSNPAQDRMRLELLCRYAALPACLALVVLAATACRSTPAPPAPPQLLPRETFDWTGEKISFSIPPAGWRREGDSSGGVKGIRF